MVPTLDRARNRLRSIGKDHQLTLLTVSVVVGLAVGSSAMLFRDLLDLFQLIFFGTEEENLADFVSGLDWWQILLAPAAGGLLVGIYLRTFLGGSPQGVVQVMEASALRGGRMPLRSAFHGAVANALTLGSGGSSGREGPVVHLGAAIAAWLGRVFGQRRSDGRTLLACGVAGAVAASFNAPLAGIFFAQEVVIGHYALRAVAPVAISSVVATLVSHARYGAFPAFIIPDYHLGSWLEFPAFALLGVVTAFTAVIFMRSIKLVSHLTEKLMIPIWVRPALAGLAVGVIALAYPQVLGVGYGATDDALKAEYGLWLLIALIVAKMAATALTVGCGSGGGVFSPSLFLGAMLGGAFGSVAGSVAPHLFTGVGAYAMVGMGAMAGAVLGAPISTILVIFELTGDYQLTMAVVVGTVTATSLTRAVSGASYFRAVLAERGIDLDESLERDAMRQMQVHQGTVVGQHHVAFVDKTHQMAIIAVVDDTDVLLMPRFHQVERGFQRIVEREHGRMKPRRVAGADQILKFGVEGRPFEVRKRNGAEEPVVLIQDKQLPVRRGRQGNTQITHLHVPRHR